MAALNVKRKKTGVRLKERKQMHPIKNQASNKRLLVEELDALGTTLLDIVSWHDLQTLLEAIVKRAAQLLRAEGGGLYLCDPEKEEVCCVVSLNTLEDYRGTVFKYGEGAAGTVAKTGQPLIINDYRFWPGRAKVYEEQKPFTAVLSVPMIWQGRVTGVIHVLDNIKHRRFTQSDLELLSVFANHASIAVENARLYDSAKKELVERKKIEEILRENEERYRTILENIEDGYYEVDLSGNFTFFNDSLCRMLGYSRNEMIGMGNKQYTEGENRKKLYQAFNEVYRSGVPAKVFDWEVFRKDGAKVFGEVSISLIKDSSGQPVGFRGIARDITERKQAEEEVKRTLSLLNATLESTADGILVIDREGKIVSFNRKFVQMWHIPESIMESCDDDKALSYVLNQLRYPDDFIAKVTELYSQPSAESFDLIEFNDGRVFERYSKPQWIGQQSVGRVWSFRDVTEREKQEEALRESGERYRNILESIEEGYFEVDLAGNFTFFNNSLCNILGYSKEETMGMNNRQYMEKETAHRVYQAYHQVYTTGEPFKTLEYRVIRKDGTTRFLESGASIVRDEKGDKIGFRGVVRDVTERKKAEEAISQSEERYRSLVEGSFDGIFIQKGSSIIFANRRLYEMLGYEEGELEGLDHWVVYHPDYRALTRERAQARMRGESVPNVYEVKFIRKDGSSFWGEIHAKVVDFLGEPGIQVWVKDTSERKRAEEILCAERERFRSLSESAPFGMAMIDEDGTIKYINPKFKELFGYDLTDIPDGRTWFRKAYPDPTYRHHIISTWKNDLKSNRPGEQRTRVYTVICRDGAEKTASFISVQLGKGEQLVTCEDITEQIHNEKALRENEEAARRLSLENAIMAEIGQTVSSTLNIEEVYERFVGQVRKLIPFDRIAVNLIDHGQKMVFIPYVSGVEVTDGRFGEKFPLSGSFTEEVMQARHGLLVQTQDGDEIKQRYPALLTTFQAGLRSILSVPLFSKDEVIGVLHLRSTEENAYTDKDLSLAERVANQIAGAIANAQLFTEQQRAEVALRKSEEEAKRLAQENELVAGIGRIIGSTLNIEDVYERFAEEANRLIPFDRITINLANLERSTTTIAYNKGVAVPQRKVGEDVPLSGTFTEEVLKTRKGRILQGDEEQMADRFPALILSIRMGLRSMLSVPLLSKDEVIGVLHFRSLKSDAYSERDLQLAERISNQIAGAIANARLFKELLQSEEEKMAIQDQLRQSQKMEAVGRLAGGIAHDFNNLLTVIKGYSELSLLGLKDGDPFKENVDEIYKASERAANLTRQLLAFSRKQILDFKVLNLNTLIRDLDKMLHRILGEDIELVYKLAESSSKVKTDPGQIEQVILNLVVNARDAMPSGGKLTIQTGDEEIDKTYASAHDGLAPGRYAFLSITDTGVGMTSQTKERLFEPFFTTKEKGKGTGLGLSTVYGIIKQSSGHIEVESAPGLGTTFKIYLPRVEEEEDSLSQEKTLFPTKGTETILLVEDDPLVRELSARILRDQGYQLFVAADGEEAIHLVRYKLDGKIHLLFTDVVMPKMSGKELAEWLKGLRPEVKVLFASGYTDDAIVNHGILDKAVNFIQKPFTPEALARKVREVLDG